MKIPSLRFIQHAPRASLKYALVGCVALSLVLAWRSAPLAVVKDLPRVEVVNNFPFAIRVPVRVRANVQRRGSAWRTTDNHPAQITPDGYVFVEELPANTGRTFTLRDTGGATGNNANRNTARSLAAQPDEAGGLRLIYRGQAMGRLNWDVIVRPAAAEKSLNHAAEFRALPLHFTRGADGEVFTEWTGAGERDGLAISVTARIYADGFLDTTITLRNVSAPETKNKYAAVVARWEQPQVLKPRTVNYDNHLTALAESGATQFRAGEGRHLFVQRGVDWIASTFAANQSAAWLNDFAESSTVHQDATDKRKSSFIGANIPQLGQEARADANNLYSITEVARSNISYYRSRFVDKLLPAQTDAPLAFSSRIVFNDSAMTNERADQLFLAYAGYREEQAAAQSARIAYGVPFVRFGTSYFPYSTLGENFDSLKLPGMDRDAYWPLAADTVTQWRLFADDIRRDLRLAKAMGFEIIRLHHLELLAPVDGKTKQEYLDFLFKEMRHLGLRALLDVQLPPEQVAALVARYRDVVDGVEVENEVLIFGIADGREKYWNSVYDAVKRVAPEIPVHLTASTNTGSFTRLQQLGGSSDRIGEHMYMDSVEAIPSARGFALASASYAAKVNKPPLITEWNWRGLTRMTPEARAKIYAPIFENVLLTHSMPEIYQFQFQESLAMNPRTLTGIRHYEPLWLSRRLKPEAFELMRLIEKYSSPDAPNRLVKIEQVPLTLNANGEGVANFRVTNTGNRSLTLRAVVEVPSNVTATLQSENAATLRLPPNAFANILVRISLKKSAGEMLPGFHYIFLRLEDGNKFVRYGWAEARLEGAPPIDAATKSAINYGSDALAFNFNRPLAVVYGDGAPVLELETASALTNSLESATGRPVQMYELHDLPADMRARGALVVVGTAKTNALAALVANDLPPDIRNAKQFVARVPNGATRSEWLVIGGASAEDAETAAMDLIVRYWKFAKDSASRRVGLVRKELPRGGDPTLLP